MRIETHPCRGFGAFHPYADCRIFSYPIRHKATLKAVKEKEQLLRENYTNDCERLQKHLTELKKNALQNDTDFDKIRKVGELLAEAKKEKGAIA